MVGFFAALTGALAMVALFYFTAWAKDPAPAIKVDTTPIVRDARAVTSFAPVVKKAAPSATAILSRMTRISASSSAILPGRMTATSGNARAGNRASAPELSFPPTDIF